MRPEQLVALQSVCNSKEELQAVWDNPAVFKFSHKHQAWVVLCVAADGPEDKKVLKWTACIRLANPVKRTFKPWASWRVNERLKARSILMDQLEGVGAVLGEEEFNTDKAMFFCKKLTPEETAVALKPHILGA